MRKLKLLTAGLHLIVMPVHMQDLEKPEQMYRKLGAKLVVGMPFKDQACSDTLVLPEIPSASETDKRRALARLQVRVCQRSLNPVTRIHLCICALHNHQACRDTHLPPHDAILPEADRAAAGGMCVCFITSAEALMAESPPCASYTVKIHDLTKPRCQSPSVYRQILSLCRKWECTSLHQQRPCRQILFHMQWPHTL